MYHTWMLKVSIYILYVYIYIYRELEDPGSFSQPTDPFRRPKKKPAGIAVAWIVDIRAPLPCRTLVKQRCGFLFDKECNIQNTVGGRNPAPPGMVKTL